MLTGACISRAGFNRTTAYATATWVLASEFPDIDIAYYFGGSVEAFAHHRGWTHTFIAAPLNAGIVVAGLYLFWRWRAAHIPLRGNVGHPSNEYPEQRWGLLLIFGILAGFGHMLLDYV